MTAADVLTIVSNVAFLFPAAEAFERQYIVEGIVYLFVLVCSTLYHTCNSFSGACIGLAPDVLRDMDFYMAQLCIPLIALYAIRPWGDLFYWFKTAALMIIAFGLFLCQRYFGNSAIVQMIVAAISFGSIFIYWLLYALRQCRKHGDHVKHYLPRYRWDMFALGIGLSGAACALFAAEMLNHEFYWAIHACWHVDAALGQYALLCIWPHKAVLLYDAKKPGHKGHHVTLMDPHPHPYAIPQQAVTQRKVVHLTPPSRVVTE